MYIKGNVQLHNSSISKKSSGCSDSGSNSRRRGQQDGAADGEKRHGVDRDQDILQLEVDYKCECVI